MQRRPSRNRTICSSDAQRITPAIAASVKGREFNLSDNEKYNQYLKEHPDALESLGITRSQATAILNYVNGRRSVADIGVCVAGELDEEAPLKGILGYLELLKSIGWLVLTAFDSAAAFRFWPIDIVMAASVV